MRCRRAIRTVLVYTLLAALATILTSWAIHAAQFSRLQRSPAPSWGWMMVRPEQPRPAGAMREADVRAWDAYRVLPPALGSGVLHRNDFDPPSRVHRFGWRMDAQGMSVQGPPPDSVVASHEGLAIIAAGWPRLALHHGTYSARFTLPTNPNVETRTTGLTLHGGVQLLPWTRGPSGLSGGGPGPYFPYDRFALPLLPLWPGFLINTFLYAILTFTLIRTPRLAIRARRRRRGRCVGCGYDRGGLDPGAACPECGAGVLARAGQP